MTRTFFLLAIFTALIVFINLNFISAAVNIVAPTNGTNFSSSNTVLFNVSYVNETDITSPQNATFYYNLSGTWTLIGNSSTCSINACWSNISISGLSDGVFSINATLWNLTSEDNISASISTHRITFDSTPPAVQEANFTSPLTGGNYSGTLVLNVSIIDSTIGIQTVFFNITNSTGVQNDTITASNSAGNFWNGSISTAGFPDGLYNITVYANDTLNNLNNSALVNNIRFDNTFPTITNGTGTENSSSNFSRSNIYFNITYTETNFANITFTLYNDTASVNSTTFTTATYNINWTGLADSNYTYNATVRDYAGNSNTTSTRKITLDTSGPTISFSCSSTSVDADDIITCSCGASDNIDPSPSVSYTVNPSTANSGTYTTSCSSSDFLGNSVSSEISYTVEGGGGGGGSSSGGGSSVSQIKKKSFSWSKITPGATTIMKNFDKEYGIKEIEINVNNPAQNVKITITKYSGKPAEVSKEKSGKVYKYLQINADDLEGKLSKGIVRIQVEKSWVSENGVDKDKIALFKFKDDKWNKLKTEFKEEDSDNYYYDVELESFSFFSIGGEVVNDVVDADVTGDSDQGEDVVSDGGETVEREGSLFLLWVIIAVIIIGGIAIYFFKIKNK